MTEQARNSGERYAKREESGGEARNENIRGAPLQHHEHGDIPFAVRYIKLVVECFESYHSHFDELARRIDRQEDFALHRRYVYLLNR